MKTTALSWLCLLGAAFCEMAWTYSLKFIDLPALKTLRWSTLYRPDGGMAVLLPWIVYIVSGIVNSVLLALAMRTIPTAVAFAVWMASSLIILKMTDVLWLKAGWSMTELFFGLVIIVGIVGLKWAGSAH
ncbi:small multidrug resistance protein (plasmid) [Fibrella aestuarina BUZ 2]|uniref:Guanidinium exporter n=1 Tax=Fibrella aestuarina BUZ 2 TaxID=1166018 RepID=I0KHB9_9BACT|nr:SMR family transporter [Fibrella aestuarina]CCH03522.1 small multidrug resistance protein [Fibrella aestuarina BUZ 2]